MTYNSLVVSLSHSLSLHRHLVQFSEAEGDQVAQPYQPALRATRKVPQQLWRDIKIQSKMVADLKHLMLGRLHHWMQKAEPGCGRS
jgi:hypothetical protein